MSKYTEQADKFLEDNKIEFSFENLGKEPSRMMKGKFNFRHVAKFTKRRIPIQTLELEFHGSIADYEKGIKKISAYDVLSCLEKYDPGTFNDFCSERGGNNDSMKEFAIYQAVCEEWEKTRKFFSASELKELREIQ